MKCDTMNKILKEKKSPEDYHKYLDMRAIIPAFIVSLLWSLAIAFYIPATAITEIILEMISTELTANAAVLGGIVVEMVFRAVVFVVDFILVFALSYIVLWVLFREADKKMLLEMKKKKEIK